MSKLIVANWKSNKSVSQGLAWVKEYADFWQKKESNSESEAAKDFRSALEVVVVPAMPSVGAVSSELENNPIFHVKYPSFHVKYYLGVQDISPYSAGSYTGEVSVANLDNLGVAYGIVGHSERRRYLGETNQQVASKVDQLLSAEITPIVCLDEDNLESQASAINSENLQKCVVAFEPLASIGTGKNADVGLVTEVVSRVKQLFGSVPVLYGGSVDGSNVLEYLLVSDGVLVGTASLDAGEFAKLIETVVR